MTGPEDPAIHDSRYCGGKKRQGEGNCTRPAGWGTDHAGEGRCKLHGGCSPGAAKAARERLAERKARALMTTYGVKIETTATEALLDEVKWTAGHVAYAREQLQALSPDELIWGTTQRRLTDGADEDGEPAGHPKVVESTEAAELHAWLKIYQAERTHLVKVCGEAIRCGIEERRVRMAEQDGQRVAQAIRGILDDLGLTPEQAARISEIVPRHLRALIA